MKKQKPDDWARLMHISDTLQKIMDFIKGFTEEAFVKDERTLFACIKLVEIIGEATYHLSKELKTKHPHISWKQIEGMRHKLVHDYYEIDPAIVWRVASVYIPQLKVDIEPIIEGMNT